MSIQLAIVLYPVYLEKFVRDSVVAPLFYNCLLSLYFSQAREGKRRFGVALAIPHRRCGISTYGLKGLRKKGY